MAEPHALVSPPGWPPPMWRAFVAALGRFSPPTRERGRRYAIEGRVEWIEVFADAVAAEVTGTTSYEAHWEYAQGRWEATCSCPVGVDCKHAYAAAWVLVEGAAPRTTQPVRPAPARPRLLDRLRAARGPWERQQAITELLEGRELAGLDVFGPGYHAILAESDPDILCWLLARAVAAEAGGWLPAELEPFRTRPDLATRLADRSRGEVLRDLMGWAQHVRRTPERRLRVVLTLTRIHGNPAVGVEARLTSRKLVDTPRTTFQLQQLRSEVQRSPTALPPEEIALLTWLTDHGLGGSEPYLMGDVRRMAALPGLLERISGSQLGTWGDTLAPDLAALGGVAPGDPVRLSAEPVRIELTCATRDAATWLDLRCVWPDGRSRGLGEVVHLPRTEGFGGRTSLVLADGAFSPVIAEPPPHLVARMREVNGLPLPEAERVPVLRRLATGFPHLAETVRAHTRTHAATPVVTLALHDDDWLQVRVLACTGAWRPGTPLADGDLVFELTPDEGWVRLRGDLAEPAAYAAVDADGVEAPRAPAPPPASIPDADAWLDQPDAEAVAPVAGWIEHLRATPGTRLALGAPVAGAPPAGDGWWLQLVRRRLDAFAEAWDQRPPEVVFFGTDAIRRLLGGGHRLAAKLRVEASGLDWFTVSAEWEAEGLALTDADLAVLRSASTRFVKLSTGWVDRTITAQHDEAAATLADLGIEAGGGPQRLTLWELAGARPESLRALERLGADRATMRALADLRRRVGAFRGLPAVPSPPGLVGTLRPYQQQGLDFLAYTASLGIGAILADDMGLGKTVQALAWLAHLRAADPKGGPTLVVCPASVVHNWAREAERFTPALKVLLLTRGSERHALRKAIAEHDLVVTNYALLRHDIEAWRTARLRAVILDEAQNVKNPDAVVTRAALALEARHRLALTGTPLENRPLDLWSLMSFVNPGYLGSRADFGVRYDRLDVPPHRRALLAAKLRPVLLRRLKRDVAPELPDRIEERHDCELTPGQRRLYLAELRRSRRLVDRLTEAPGGLKQHRIDVLAALTRLRQICCHPALAGSKTAVGSGKFTALFELLEPILAEGHKVLVFSQFVECLKLLAAELTARDVPHHQLTGQTTKREAVVAAFTEDERACVFLVSLKAGGTGLNLTAASYVVLFDPWWNPAVEAQAIDRTHRIGQDRTVIAYRLVSRGTIEEKIVDLQERKAALVRDVLGEGGFGRALTREDLTYLLAGDAE
ncbi:MAG: DEAD/DEAH box helicase [Candidatus Binatia bacterium]